ncbi:hypothetical protein C8F04DRAFT_1085107 [Mycena alexandri]|uniref:F-box domain-containing protein n=1 Tax=Mycena alexandri TaxID=1745969 RepID=A0AAD6T4X4_9AGAR|nr:hypothetical protein C8F04DRAFT_1085107 [Mycena alexandri]
MPPSSKERVKVQIDSTESNIRLLTSLIHGLTCALDEERRTLARLWFMILPVGKLPTEVLLHIFALAVESEPTNLAGIRERPPFGPNHPVWQALRLSQVCSSWRQMVIHSPKLWAAGVVDVRLDTMGKHPRKTYLALLQTLIDRSSPLPIAISVNHTFDGSRPSIGAITQIVAPTTSRWKALKINDTAFTAFKETSPGPFTALEHLDLEYAASSQTSPIDLFFLCPRLRRLTVVPQGYYYMSRRKEHDVLRMPWPQITHLELVEPLDSATCRAILLQCVNIVSASLTTIEWDKGDIDAPLTTLPSLHTLEMRFDPIRDPAGVLEVGPFFAPLDLPVLRSLELSFSCAWPDREFAAFQHRCSNITQIRLSHCPILSHQLVSVLRLAPALTHLSLEDCENCIDDRFLEAFRQDGVDSQQLVPKLRELNWRGIDHRRFADDVFEAAIRSRCRTDATPPDAVRLQKANLDVYSRRLFDRMQDLVKHGVSFI